MTDGVRAALEETYEQEAGDVSPIELVASARAQLPDDVDPSEIKAVAEEIVGEGSDSDGDDPPVAEWSGRELYPAALQERDWWVNWVLAVPFGEDGDPDFEATATKQPVAPYQTGHAKPVRWHAGLDDDEHPSTAFDDVERWAGISTNTDVESHERVLSDEVGVGIIIPVGNDSQNPITLLDWDDVRDPETGEVHPVCAEALGQLGGFAEISQSGEGIHQFVFGEIPGGFSKFLRHIDDEPFVGDSLPMLEMYSSGRLTAMTGRHVDGCGDDVVEGQQMIDYLCWRFGTWDNNAEGTPTDPFGRESDGDSDHETPDHDDVGEALRDAVAYDGDDPEDWDIPDDEPLEYHAVLRAREREPDMVNTANWELLGYAAAFAAANGISKDQLLADLESHDRPGYEFDERKARKEVRGVFRKADNGGYEPPSTSTLVQRGILPDRYAPAESPPPSSDDCLTTDGGVAATADGEVADESESPPEPDSPDEADGSDDEDDPWESWQNIRTMFRNADNSDERATPRFESAMRLHRQESFANLQENEVLYCYNSETGIYEANGKQVVRQRLTNNLEEQYRGHTMSEVMDHIRGRNTMSQTEMGGPDGLIAAQNCVIDLHDECRRDHSPEFMFQSRLGADFDPDADCPQWRAFLNDSVPSEVDRKKLQEFAGYCLHHWDLPYHKALFLVGPTASGKSTFLDTINELLGDDTVSSLTPQQLTSERFAPAELFGKWANIRNDIPKATVENTGMFKEVVAGDPMKAEKKNKDPFFFNPTAKHLFSANQLPEMDVDDEAFFRRVLLVAFPETVPEPERDKHLDDKLRDELSGILNWAIEGLQRLLGNGQFTGDKSPAHTRETWSKWGDSVKRFAQHAIADGDDDIPKSMLYAAYLQYCREESIPTDTQNMMTRQLKMEGFDDGRAYVDGDRQRVFHNIAWTSRGQQLLDAAQSNGDSRDDDTRNSGISSFD